MLPCHQVCSHQLASSNLVSCLDSTVVLIAYMVRDAYLSQDCNKANGNQDIVVRVCNDLEIFGFLTLPTLSVIDNNGGMDKNIIYAVLHESIYCQG